MTTRKEALASILLAILLVAAYLIYKPGITGTFSFDDYPTLSPIADIGGIHDRISLQRFVLGGDTGPGGRPLTLLSFLLDSNEWPSDPEPFKYTNILIHLLNGALICWLTLRLARALDLAPANDALMAVLTTSLWLLHPLHTSTVLFIVQRMTELMATFVLAGLIAYTHGRQIVDNNPTRGYAWMTGGLVVGGILSILCKENGVLLLLYVLSLEFFLFRPMGLAAPTHWRSWASVFIYAPILLLVGYFLFTWSKFSSSYLTRDFTLEQRLLTESRVVFDYLYSIVLPRTGESGLFHDDFIPSRSLIAPISTLLSVLVIGALLLLPWVLRRRFPVASFALIWFFAGHTLESTFFPLELYFEHRNYLPMFGLTFATGYYLVSMRSPLRFVAYASICAFLSMQVFLTVQNTRLWGNPLDQSEIWSKEHPSSLRAQQLAAWYWTAKGNFLQARSHIEKAIAYHPDNTGLHLQLIQNRCNQGDLTALQIRNELPWIKKGDMDYSALDTIQKLINTLDEKSCPQLTATNAQEILNALFTNPNYQDSKSLGHLYYIQATLAYHEKDLDKAITNLQRAYTLLPGVDVALNEAYWLATAGLFEPAAAAMKKARLLDEHTYPWKRGLRMRDIDFWDVYIQQLKKSSAAVKSSKKQLD